LKGTLIGHSDSIQCVAFDQNGLLASGSRDNTIMLWNTKTKQLLNTLEGHTGPVSCVAFDKNGLLASGSLDNTIKLWNTTTGQLIKNLEGGPA
jgi:WD40 repeat protein